MEGTVDQVVGKTKQAVQKTVDVVTKAVKKAIRYPGYFGRHVDE